MGTELSEWTAEALGVTVIVSLEFELRDNIHSLLNPTNALVSILDDADWGIKKIFLPDGKDKIDVYTIGADFDTLISLLPIQPNPSGTSYTAKLTVGDRMEEIWYSALKGQLYRLP